MIVNYVLKSGAQRAAIVTHTYQFGPPDKPENAIWDRRHEGLINATVFLDPTLDHQGADFDGQAVAGGLFLHVQQVAFDASGKQPGTWNNDLNVPASTPPAPSVEFETAVQAAAAQGQTVVQARKATASIGG